jgi:release factor glutamine methyltransferase
MLGWARRVLRCVGSDTPELDAEVLLGHCLGQQRAWLLAHPEQALDPATADAYATLVQRRAAGEPVAYLVGRKEFFGLDFDVTLAVLVPRPETELLVEVCLSRLSDRAADRTIVDLGTGSGILAVTLAVHLPRARLVATDLSPHALRLARQNAARHNVVDRVAFVQADLLGPFGPAFDVIVSNPPYLRSDEIPRHAPTPAHDTASYRADTRSADPLAWEPHKALDGGWDGLQVARRLLHTAPQRLRSGGVLLIEIGAGQGASVMALAHKCFPRADIALHRDYAGLDRVLVVCV